MCDSNTDECCKFRYLEKPELKSCFSAPRHSGTKDTMSVITEVLGQIKVIQPHRDCLSVYKTAVNGKVSMHAGENPVICQFLDGIRCLMCLTEKTK